ncbi:hypothetical protein [Arthrobacter sp. ISL-28]|uniref:hypothetical protein n=1 Tax=Arthrobacter sp. ISL-28 TaxID=2819108 RepID=UPI002034DD46|nr:hypothetical protein [Arthrobacter sp. ISL-28]
MGATDGNIIRQHDDPRREEESQRSRIRPAAHVHPAHLHRGEDPARRGEYQQDGDQAEFPRIGPECGSR